MKRFTFAAAALLAALLALCLGVSAQGSSGRATVLRLTGGEFYFKPSAPTVPRGKVVVVFTNAGQVAHDFKIDGKKTPVIQPHRSARLVLTFTKRGRYPFSCTVPGHAQAGMKGILTVR